LVGTLLLLGNPEVSGERALADEKDEAGASRSRKAALPLSPRQAGVIGRTFGLFRVVRGRSELAGLAGSRNHARVSHKALASSLDPF
jgi:hypothetical protein